MEVLNNESFEQATLLKLGVLGSFKGEIKLAVLVFILSAFALYVSKEYKKKKLYNLPPGPVGLPLVGYMPFIGPKPHKTFNGLRSKFGNIFGLYLGSQYTLVLNDIASIKEAFSKNEFSGRPIDVFKFTDIYENIINMNGQMWIEHMRYNKSILRQLGMGKSKIEEVIREELLRTMSKLEKIKPGEDMCIHALLSNSIDNVIYSMICGKRYEEGDPMAKVMENYQIYIQRYFSSSAIHAYFPYLKTLSLWMDPLLRGAKRAVNKIEIALEEEIENHEKNHDENVMADFMDYSLSEIKKRNGQNGFTKNILNGSSQIFLLGGSETSRVTLEWSLMLLAKYPEIQERAHQEIVEAFGTEKMIGWDDREYLPYLNAIVFEIQRRKTLVPMNVLRRTQRNTTVGGFDIPENTTVIANIWAIHMDPNTWNNPKEFNPDRYLINGGLKAKAPEYHIPFSYGQRMCPGERLATMQLFISLSNLIQKYRFKPPKNGQDFTGELRLVYVPKNPIVSVEKR